MERKGGQAEVRSEGTVSGEQVDSTPHHQQQRHETHIRYSYEPAVASLGSAWSARTIGKRRARLLAHRELRVGARQLRDGNVAVQVGRGVVVVIGHACPLAFALLGASVAHALAGAGVLALAPRVAAVGVACVWVGRGMWGEGMWGEDDEEDVTSRWLVVGIDYSSGGGSTHRSRRGRACTGQSGRERKSRHNRRRCACRSRAA